MRNTDGLSVAKRQIRANQRYVSFFTLIAFPAGLSLWVEKADPTTVGAWPFWIVVVAFASAQLVAFLWLSLGAADTAPMLLLKCLEQEDEQSRFAEVEWRREREIAALTASVALSKSWSAIQAHLPVALKREDVDLKTICQRIVTPLMSSSDEIFGFEAKDRWSIAVYRWNAEADRLEAVYWERERDHPSSGVPRSWRDGEGHSGTAFMAQQTLFTNDLAEPSTQNRVMPSPSNHRSYDASAYRSFATVPLSITDESDEPKRLGVVAITSDQLGRFDQANIGVVEQLADVLSQALWTDGIADPVD